jgi:hypothetical protein
MGTPVPIILARLNHQRPIMAQEPFLARHTTTISGHRSICTNHPVTWHHDGNRIAAIGRAHRPAHIDVAKLARDGAVRDCGARGDFEQFGPDLFFERRTAAISKEAMHEVNAPPNCCYRQRQESFLTMFEYKQGEYL